LVLTVWFGVAGFLVPMKHTNYRNALVFNTLVNNDMIPCVASTVVEYAHELAGNPISYSEEVPLSMHLLAAPTNSKFDLLVTNGARLYPCEKYKTPKERASGVLITCLIGLPNGTFVSDCWNGYISIWDQDALFVITSWRSSTFKVRALGVLSENLLVSGDDHLRIWELSTKTQISEAITGDVQALCVGHHGTIYASNERGCLFAFTFNSENNSLQKILGIRHGELILSLAGTHRGQLLAGFAGGDVYMWEDVYQGATTVARCDARVLAIIVLPDGRFVTGCDNDEVQIWDVESGLVQRLHDGTPHSTLESMEFAVLKTGYLVCGNRHFLSVWK